MCGMKWQNRQGATFLSDMMRHCQDANLLRLRCQVLPNPTHIHTDSCAESAKKPFAFVTI